MKKTALLVSLAVLGIGAAHAADPAKINWGKIPAVTVPLFFPGQSSYEWLRSEAHEGAVKEVVRGDSCTSCHDEEDAEKDIGEEIVKGGRLEPRPVKGKSGYKALKVQAAYDAKNAYLRFQWKTDNAYPGSEHQYLRFDGKEWKVFGYPKLDKPVQDGQEMGIYEDRMSIMIDDGKVLGFANQGCWLTCHDGQRDMAKQFTKDEVAGNALLQAIKKRDVRKYLPDTRTDPSDWKTGKSVEDIAKIKAAGGFVDLIQWRAHRSNPVGMTDDGYVLEFRLSDSGKDMFGGNADAKTHQPKFMWDASKVGYKSITVDQLRKGDHYLIREQNAVPFDPNAGWKEGDMIPDYIVSRADAKGSAADNNAIASWKDGMWAVVMVRPLGLANDDDKALKAGGVYNVGFAVHDDNITTRGHQVSFVKTIGFGSKADIKAVKLP
ncbi:ethylbenzene dehydrogenase-related protein [Aromatoleum toluolicum]|uniref:Cytochrome c-552/DMSO reductase-like haem-binding domain-containing protein n=1 Tax=Aromatoleum toluolicum TaxID=90060 RepID=A0ABX1NK04_9RHOO|nr:ethylbenzene dehydrogenase-related protein [Aromatoleum toluolicum]NMF99652.1 ethylbenzene dehydrogenase-related protein [Aromatoleum toluolicum]